MKHTTAITLSLILALTAITPQTQGAGRGAKSDPPQTSHSQNFHWDSNSASIQLLDADRTVWQFNFAPSLAKPYFDPITLPGSPSLTYQPIDDHPWHHGLWFCWKYINGLNYWEENKQGASEGLTTWRKPQVQLNKDHSATIRLELAYAPPNQSTILTESRTIKISTPAPDGSFHLDWTMTFTAKDQPVLFDRTPLPGEPNGKSFGGYAGLSMRFPPNLTQRKFTATNPNIQDPTRFIATAVDYHGLLNSQPLGVAMLDHPQNLNAPSPWYLIIDNPRAMNYFSPAVIQYKPHTLAPHQSFTLRYRVLIHPGRWNPKRLAAEYKRYHP